MNLRQDSKDFQEVFTTDGKPNWLPLELIQLNANQKRIPFDCSNKYHAKYAMSFNKRQVYEPFLAGQHHHFWPSFHILVVEMESNATLNRIPKHKTVMPFTKEND
jgi:hypothetical protein